MIAMRFLNASVLERKAPNRNLSWGFPLGNLLPKTRVLKHRVLERKRRPNANASVLGTQRFGTRSSIFYLRKLCYGSYCGWEAPLAMYEEAGLQHRMYVGSSCSFYSLYYVFYGVDSRLNTLLQAQSSEERPKQAFQENPHT